MNPLSKTLEVADAKHRVLARGWNTWDTRSMLHHVLLPEGFCIRLGFAAPDKLVWLSDAFPGRREMGRTPGTKLTSTDKQLPLGNAIEVRPGARAYDGAYTELVLNLRGARYRVETAAEGENWVALVTPLQDEPWTRVLTVHAGFLWNRPGVAQREDDHRLTARAGERAFAVHVEGDAITDPNLPVPSPYVAVKLNRPIGVSAGIPQTLAQVEARIASVRAKVEAWHQTYGPLADAHAAMQGSLAWNTIYEPKYDRVLCPVARDWNCLRGGYAVFCWDSFFTGWMLSLDHSDLAWAVVLETFREMIDGEFVSNVVQGTGRAARDRSQPPVAALCVLGMHLAAPDPAALEAAWPALLSWNRWWNRARKNQKGSLSLGSNPFEPRVGDPAEFVQPNTAAGAALEALDNSPMYEHAPFDPQTHLMQIEDVGLNALYVADCTALAEIATLLGHTAEAAELKTRAAHYGGKLQDLWQSEQGLFLNRRLDTGEWSERHSPTSFYPLLAGVASKEQAERLVREHLLNPEEYFGEWMIPAAPRNDPAFAKQLYMCGRIWPPINFLTYLGLNRYGETAAQRLVVEKSLAMLLKNWREHGLVPENFSAIDGSGGIGEHTHPMLTWGGLPALMALIDSGKAKMPLGRV